MKRFKNFKRTCLVIIICILSIQSFGQTKNLQEDKVSDSIAVVQTINNFLSAFSNLQWDEFTTFFADDVTVFFPPSANFPNRANNKIEVENIFRNVFANARKQKASPPYLTIKPKNLKIQMLNDVAIITFELNDPGMFGRRTIVMKKENNSWLIIHLHASGIVADIH